VERTHRRRTSCSLRPLTLSAFFAQIRRHIKIFTIDYIRSLPLKAAFRATFKLKLSLSR